MDLYDSTFAFFFFFFKEDKKIDYNQMATLVESQHKLWPEYRDAIRVGQKHNLLKF